jgi:predicted TIM-barrel fold metal-dependent hydrolase
VIRDTIDCDVHCQPAGMDTLLPYLDPFWETYVEQARIRLATTVGNAYPPGARTSGVTPQTVEELHESLLDHARPRYAVLNCLTAFQASLNPSFDAALAGAVNDWLKAEWLDRDDRLRASIAISMLDPLLAAQEIERVAADPRYVQVLMPVRAEAPYGNSRYDPIFEAAARHGLAIGIHAWGRVGRAPVPAGYTHYYLEDYVANSQVAQAQLVSLVSGGVFQRFPGLRVAFLECGFAWLPPLLWRFDKNWKAVWREVPWLTEKPSEYVHRHVRTSLEPAHVPADRDAIARVAQLARVGELGMFASDHPHAHGGHADTLLEVLDEDAREAVLRGNAAAFFGLAQVLGRPEADRSSQDAGLDAPRR